MKNLGIITFFFLIQSVFVYPFITGGSLHPIDDTNVSIYNKRLVLTINESHVEVEAYFELYNHESLAIEPLLGFEFFAPWSVPSGISIFNLLENARHFILTVNNTPRIFEHQTRVEGEEAGTITIHTLAYRTRLNPGRNLVFYRIQLPLFGNRLTFRLDFSFNLQENQRWKNSEINNFEVVINTEFNTVITFENWASQNLPHFYARGQSRRVDDDYILTPEGYLTTNIQNFIPDGNIFFTIRSFFAYSRYFDFFHRLIHDWKWYIQTNLTTDRWWHEHEWPSRPSPEMLQDLNLEQLRIMRNTLFAMHGFVFNDNFLNEHFNKQY